METNRRDNTLLFFIIAVCIHHGLCYPYGPPLSVCDNGLPVHVTKDGAIHEPQTSPCPFQITVNVTSYSPGEVISVLVSSDSKATFKGLFLQMRAVPGSDDETVKNEPIGSFRRRIQNTKVSACDVGLDTVFHKDPFLKTETRLDWKAPLLMNNGVIVRATILFNFSTYWTNVESKRIKLVRPDKLPAESLERPWVDEIMKTLKTTDRLASRDLVKSRFTRGYRGVMDPNGYIMVHYVMDLLPFQDKHYGVNYTDTNGNKLGINLIDKISLLNGSNSKTSTSDGSIADKVKTTNLTKVQGARKDVMVDKVSVKSDSINDVFKDKTADIVDVFNKYAVNATNDMSRQVYERLVKLALDGNKDAVDMLEAFLVSPRNND